MKYILENTTADLPPPCSPKSIYILANLVNLPLFITQDVELTLKRWKLNIEPLRNIALEDIESKISENNVVEEFFSCIIDK